MVLPGAILFPNAMLPLYIFEPRYKRMLADALDTHRMFSVAMQRPGRIRETPCNVAGLGIIRASVNNKDGTSHLILQGIARIELAETVRYRPYRVHRIKPIETANADSVIIDALAAKLRELVAERLQQGPHFTLPAMKKIASLSGSSPKLDSLSAQTLKKLAEHLSGETDPAELTDIIACVLLDEAEQRQAILETTSLEERLKRLIRFLLAQIKGNSKSNN